MGRGPDCSSASRDLTSNSGRAFLNYCYDLEVDTNGLLCFDGMRPPKKRAVVGHEDEGPSAGSKKQRVL